MTRHHTQAVKLNYYNTTVPQSAEYSPPEDGEEEPQEEDDKHPNPGT